MEKRNANIELLRILSMFFIICFHYVFKSNYVMPFLSLSSVLVQFFYFLGELGVNLFVLITGYFMVHGTFKIKKVLDIVLQVYFYYFLCYFIAIGLDITVFDFHYLFPLFTNHYWFITSYLLLYIFSPYLNLFLLHMDQKTHKKLLCTLLVLFSFVPTILGIFYNTTEGFLYYSRFLWFIILYLVGAYIKIYGVSFLTKKRRNLVCICTICFLFLSIIVLYVGKPFFTRLGTTQVAYFWPPNSVPIFLLSVCIFLFFLHKEVKKRKWIYVFSSHTLAVYMLHDGMLQGVIWKMFGVSTHIYSPYAPFSIILSGILIFIIGTFIDIIRSFLFTHTIYSVWFSKKILSPIKNIYVKLFPKIESCDTDENKI